MAQGPRPPLPCGACFYGGRQRRAAPRDASPAGPAGRAKDSPAGMRSRSAPSAAAAARPHRVSELPSAPVGFSTWRQVPGRGRRPCARRGPRSWSHARVQRLAGSVVARPCSCLTRRRCSPIYVFHSAARRDGAPTGGGCINGARAGFTISFLLFRISFFD
ncbi:hypothetical protein PVAP13_7NG293424 [Panicum virgatum]|uniref:Uncharacterized protein n=1 Tax=Panicum virgatum TaxID=38727 RepID=A0A8T0Q620_PANVG|nr:hypothetical protein PVAP13_7NG293424 [Panicum virgatum]